MDQQVDNFPDCIQDVLFSRSEDAIALVSEELVVRETNPAFDRLLGWRNGSSEERDLLTFFEGTDASEPSQRQVLVEKALNAGHESGAWITIASADGKRRPAVFSLIEVGAPAPRYYFAIVRTGHFIERGAMFNKVTQIAADRSRDLSGRLDEMLDLTLDYFRLDVAVLSQVKAGRHRLTNVRPPKRWSEAPDVTVLTTLFRDKPFETPDVLAIANVAASEFANHPARQALGLNALIAAPIWVNGSNCGNISLFSRTERSADFDEFDMIVMRNLARFISNEIEYTTNFEVMRRNNKVLEEKNEALQQFAFVASHDLQEPLRKITQFGSFLKEDYADELPDDAKNYIDIMQSAAQRMSSLVKSVLDYGRTTNRHLDVVPLDLAVKFNIILDDISALIAESDAQIDIGDLPLVYGDRAMVMQIFGNLLRNAIRYRAASRVPIVKVRSADVGHAYKVSISDNGIGFDMAFASKIMEPFRRLHSRTEYEGTGIGLAICKNSCQRLGWSIHVDSTVGVGSTFTVVIPKQKGR